MTVALAPVDFARLLDRVEDRNSFEVGAALARHDAPNHLGAIFAARAGMDLPGRAGDALGEDAGVLVYEDAHLD